MTRREQGMAGELSSSSASSETPHTEGISLLRTHTRGAQPYFVREQQSSARGGGVVCVQRVALTPLPSPERLADSPSYSDAGKHREVAQGGAPENVFFSSSTEFFRFNRRINFGCAPAPLLYPPAGALNHTATTHARH